MTTPPTWLLVLLAVALVVAVLAVRDYREEEHHRNVEPSLIGTDADGHFGSRTLAEVNAERARTGDVLITPYNWAEWWREKREGWAWAFGSLLGGSFGR